MKEDTLLNIAMVALAWVLLSVLVSVGQVDQNNCDKTFPINYLVYSRLFCEVK